MAWKKALTDDRLLPLSSLIGDPGIGVYTYLEEKELLGCAFSRSKRRGEDVKKERVGSAVLLPFSPLTMGAFRRVIDRFRVPEPQEQASKEARLRFVTPPSKSIFSRSDTSIRTQRRFWNGYTRTTVRALSSNNRSVSTLTNFRELAIKGNEETGKSKCGVNIDGGYRNSCENSPTTLRQLADE